MLRISAYPAHKFPGRANNPRLRRIGAAAYIFQMGVALVAGFATGYDNPKSDAEAG
jgi:hypothetical protein